MEFALEPAQWALLGKLLGAGFAVGLGGIGAAMGMGIAAGNAVEGIMRQPQENGVLLRTMLIGQAVVESAAIFALVVGLLILFVPTPDDALIGGTLIMSYIAAGLAIGFGAFGSGLGCGYPGAYAAEGVARNPRRINRMTQLMLIGQAVAQSPSIFALVVSIILLFTPHEGSHWAQMGIVLGAGIAMGASALGAGFGSGYTAGGAVRGSAHWPQAHGLTFRTMLVGQGVCETPAIFGLLVALIMLYGLGDAPNDIIGFAKTLGAGIAMGFGGLGPGIGSGMAGASGCSATALNPRHDALILRTMLIGQAVAQSTAMYALIIALLLLYVF